MARRKPNSTLPLRNKEISWLAFNGRVLQEASDPSVPLLERLTFLGIFSSNLDEFFRVRVAHLRRLEQIRAGARRLMGDDPAQVLQEIHAVVLKQQADFESTYRSILGELRRHGISMVTEKDLNRDQQAFIEEFYQQKLRPNLIPLMINHLTEFPQLKDQAIYMAIWLYSSGSRRSEYALIEIPTDVLSRFVILPRAGDRHYVILLDDVIRYCLKDIFSIFPFDHFEAYTIKLTRDAQLDLDDDLYESYIEKISKGLKQRRSGAPVRFIYDNQIPRQLLKLLKDKMGLDDQSGPFIPGGRYHNFKDFMGFPRIGPKDLSAVPLPPLPHKHLDAETTFFKAIRRRDILVHYPYQTFDCLIEFLRQAAIDPKVRSIKMTLYRVARNSKIVNALINASRNGKKVTVVMELQARFDEADNVYWSERLQEEGVRVIHGVPGLKVHAKLILITRVSNRKTVLYANVSSGNFNETTARIYTDDSLFTVDERITSEVKRVFSFLESNYRRTSFKHLLVSPYDTRRKLTRLIDTEIKNAGKGLPAWIILKVNNLEDRGLIKKLYEASEAGVDVRLMVRGMFSLVPGVKDVSERIKATAILDRFLEHSRVMAFADGGDEKFFISSGDWMERNVDHRVEVACPVYDPSLKRRLKDLLDILWDDNVKARVLDKDLRNRYQPATGDRRTHAQEAIYAYLAEHHAPEPEAGVHLRVAR
ncbi:MAG: polyphosphate kinase 1 [Deltaproteobacteria bacterium]|nr:polyphosphate kinase 1 [Deltaproteobacteria bacterium]